MTTTTKVTWADANILCTEICNDEILQGYRKGREALGTGLGYIIHEANENDARSVPLYSITHLASGYCVVNWPILTEDLAKRLTIAFAPLTDWHMPMEKVTRDKALGARISETYGRIATAYWDAIEAEREDH